MTIFEGQMQIAPSGLDPKATYLSEAFLDTPITGERTIVTAPLLDQQATLRDVIAIQFLFKYGYLDEEDGFFQACFAAQALDTYLTRMPEAEAQSMPWLLESLAVTNAWEVERNRRKARRA